MPGRSANVSGPGRVPVLRIFSYPDKITNFIRAAAPGPGLDQAAAAPPGLAAAAWRMLMPPGPAAGPGGRSRTLLRRMAEPSQLPLPAGPGRSPPGDGRPAAPPRPARGPGRAGRGDRRNGAARRGGRVRLGGGRAAPAGRGARPRHALLGQPGDQRVHRGRRLVHAADRGRRHHLRAAGVCAGGPPARRARDGRDPGRRGRRGADREVDRPAVGRGRVPPRARRWAGPAPCCGHRSCWAAWARSRCGRWPRAWSRAASRRSIRLRERRSRAAARGDSAVRRRELRPWPRWRPWPRRRSRRRCASSRAPPWRAGRSGTAGTCPTSG